MPTTPWRQYCVTFPDRHTAHRAAVATIGPALEEARAAGLLHDWWFLRKDPWRLRCRAAVLCRAAGLDQFEHGDVWRRVAHLRPEPAPFGTARADQLTRTMGRLMTCDGHAALTADLTAAGAGADWYVALVDAGTTLAD